jgi:hypothetical protein
MASTAPVWDLAPDFQITMSKPSIWRFGEDLVAALVRQRGALHSHV